MFIIPSPTRAVVAPPAPGPWPPAEDWVRTGIAQVTMIDDEPPTTGVVLMAGKMAMRDDRDCRALLADFRMLGEGANDNPQAFQQALDAAKLLSHQLNVGNLWLSDPAVAVLRGRDGNWWGVLLREGDGTEPLASSDSRVPNMHYGNGKRYEVTGKIRDLQAVVSGDDVTDLREPIG